MERIYPVGMSVLYAALRTLSTNGKNNIVKLAEFKSKYTNAYFDAFVEEIATAEGMKSEQARNAEHESIRVELVNLASECREFWQNLKRYIADAFGEEFAEINWDAAGWANYADASNDKWDKVTALMNDASIYGAENKAKLQANGFMPDAFLDDMNAKALEFNTRYDDFIQAEENAMDGTAAKVVANNNLWKKAVGIALDGQTVFMKDEVKKKQFSLEAIGDLISPPGAASALLEISNANTGIAISGVEALIVGTDHTATTDAEGRGEMTQLKAGKAQLKLMCDGFEDLFMDYTFKPGVRARIVVKMKPLVLEVTEETVVQPEAPAVPA